MPQHILTKAIAIKAQIHKLNIKLTFPSPNKQTNTQREIAYYKINEIENLYCFSMRILNIC